MKRSNLWVVAACALLSGCQRASSEDAAEPSPQPAAVVDTAQPDQSPAPPPEPKPDRDAEFSERVEAAKQSVEELTAKLADLDQRMDRASAELSELTTEAREVEKLGETNRAQRRGVFRSAESLGRGPLARFLDICRRSFDTELGRADRDFMERELGWDIREVVDGWKDFAPKDPLPEQFATVDDFVEAVGMNEAVSALDVELVRLVRKIEPGRHELARLIEERDATQDSLVAAEQDLFRAEVTLETYRAVRDAD